MKRMMMIGRAMVVAVTLVTLAACSDGVEPVSPSNTPPIPRVTSGVGTEKVAPGVSQSPGVDPNESDLSIGSAPVVIEPAGIEAGEQVVAPLLGEELNWQRTQKPLADIAARAEATYSDTFAYSYFGQDGVFHIGFAADAPDEIVLLLKGTALPVAIDVGLGFNSEDYQEAVDRVTTQVITSLGPVAEGASIVVGAAPNLGDKAILVSVWGGGLDASALARRAESAGLDAAGFDVKFGTEREPVKPTGYNRAGGMWLVNTAGTGVCTTAFTALGANSDLGPLTAGHCPNNVRYYNPGNGEVYQLDYRNGTVGSNGDIKFLRSDRMMDAWFHVNGTKGRAVLEVRDSYLGETVCRYGRASNYQSCGTVTYSNANILIDYGSSGSAVVGHQDYIDGAGGHLGDSGGPAFGGNTAMGVISGGNTEGTTITRISAAQSATGTRVCLDPVCR